MGGPFEPMLVELRAVAAAYPESYEETPWGELAVKVRKKVFAFFGASDTALWFTAKLPQSRESALAMPECEPTHYGMGKHGWVTARFSDPDAIDMPTLLGWLEESYRTIAPKRLSKTVPEGGPVPGAEVPLPELPDDALEVIVVSDDVLRAERCVRALAENGVRGLRATTADLDALADASAAAILVDLGRSQAIALELAGQLALLHFDCPLVLGGIRDAKAEEAARTGIPSAALLSRDPPGDPTLVGKVLELLG